MFISQIGMDRKQNEIVAAIAHLAQNLGIRIVAEGVETVAQATFLAELGCEVAQGFLYSRPVPADSVPSVLAGLKQYRNDTSALH
jgi:EAL domain-containing protein (putative c-di-GMP-specific phosphodiesterase class I)